MKKTSKKIIAVCLILGIIFTSFCACSKKKENDITESTTDKTTESVPISTTVIETSTVVDTTAAPTTTNAPMTQIQTTQAPTQAPTQEQTVATDNTINMSVPEAVAIYNEAVNKVKSQATTITRHYEHMKSDDRYLEMPSAIQSIAKTAMGMFISGSDTPVTWTSKDDFKLGFPVSNEDYSSHLTTDMVQTVTCKDNGSAFEIELILYNDAITSPAKGEGYAGVFTTVTADTILGVSVPGVTFEKINVNGIDGKIKCTIDKASTQVTDIVFTNTDILDMRVKVLVSSVNAKFALACERSYSVEY